MLERPLGYTATYMYNVHNFNLILILFTLHTFSILFTIHYYIGLLVLPCQEMYRANVGCTTYHMRLMGVF